LLVTICIQWRRYNEEDHCGNGDSDDDQESENRSRQHQVASKRLDVTEHGERELIELATVSSLYDVNEFITGFCLFFAMSSSLCGC